MNRGIAVVLGLTLAAAACGGGVGAGRAGSADLEPGAGPNVRAADQAPDEGRPRRGGEITYALDAETNGGYCLPRAQLALGGIYVATTVYDTLVAPNEAGEFVPYLAESVEPNPTYDEWTITLRAGIRFHNGELLTADVVKQNLDAYRDGLLFQFVFSDIRDVEVVDPLTVKVVLDRPWVVFDSYLFSSGRLGIAAPEQLADDATCPENMIGTGPFELVEWKINDRLVVERNADYWREGLPYLDRITFRPVPERSQRVNGLLGGEFDIAYVTEGNEIDQLEREAASGKIDVVETGDLDTLVYTLLNVTTPPFDNKNARLAVAHAIDRDERNEVVNGGSFTVADQPFTPDDPGYVDPDTLDYPRYDPEEAREYVERYEEETGERLSFGLASTPEANVVKDAEIVQDQLAAVGIETEISTAQQAQFINQLLAGEFEMALWANVHGGDPDTSYVWWHSDSPVNFARFDDPEIDAALERGRSEPDPAKREAIYSVISVEFADGLYNLWSWYSRHAWGLAPEVRGLYGPELPDGQPSGIYVDLHSTAGLWLDD